MKHYLTLETIKLLKYGDKIYYTTDINKHRLNIFKEDQELIFSKLNDEHIVLEGNRVGWWIDRFYTKHPLQYLPKNYKGTKVRSNL